MEVPGMDEVNKTESHMTSASAFVEGGIQEACEDACSICLEAFAESDPSTVTSCKHEFHLQCILEWCQRSSNCPMCWQSISLKDPTSQELLEAVERERSFRFNTARNSTIFHHPTLGDFELQHLPVNANNTELEERIIQHLAAAAAMGRAHHIARRDGSRSRSSANGRRQFLVFSSHLNSPTAGPVSASPGEQVEHEAASQTIASPSVTVTAGGGELSQHNQHLPSAQRSQISASASRSTVTPINRQGISINNRNFASQSSLLNPEGPSDFHSLSDSWKSRLNAISMKYKDSISKSTRVWKEKLFSRSTSMANVGSEVRREVDSGIANVSHMMDRLETTENDPAVRVFLSNNMVESSASEQINHNIVETRQERPSTDNKNAAVVGSSVSH